MPFVDEIESDREDLPLTDNESYFKFTRCDGGCGSLVLVTVLYVCEARCEKCWKLKIFGDSLA